MTVRSTLLAAGLALAAALPATAEDAIAVMDPYARSSGMMANSGAAFMMIENRSGTDDRLVGASSDVAEKTELHTHEEDEMGVMRMIHVEEGFEIPAGGTLMMARGGHHVMFLGLSEPMEQGDTVTLTLEFEEAGEVTVEVPVDLERQPRHGMGHGAGHGTGQATN